MEKLTKEEQIEVMEIARRLLNYRGQAHISILEEMDMNEEYSKELYEKLNKILEG